MEKNILIVEDDKFLQGLAVTKLQKEGYKTKVASNSLEGIKAVEESKPDLIILDLLLPGGSGFDVLSAVKGKEDTKGIPVIVFSNLSEEKDTIKAKELGASSFMTKSNFTLDELVDKVKEFIK